MKNRHTDISECVHCHRCREHCPLLTKYQIDIGDEEQVEELIWHCFLCGRCTEVCPKGIDGRAYILRLRQKEVSQAGGRLRQKGYGMLLLEKQKYLFRNYRHASAERVLFPGCNFPSFYPETTKKLIRLLKEKAGIGVAYDCCGKPVAELGMAEQEEQIIRRIDGELSARGVKEIIVVCPNCYEFLKPRLSVRVVSIYETLRQLGLGRTVPGGERLFLPCPDREGQEWRRQIEAFAEKPYESLTETACCGLGGSAGVREPELAKSFAGRIAETGSLCVYCASCGGNLTRNGCDARHVLSEILGVEERPDTRKSTLNRAATKFL